MNTTDLADSEIILNSTYDIKAFYRSSPERKYLGHLHGIITRVNKRGGIIFYNFHDGFGTIQIIANKNDFSEGQWEEISSLKNMTRLAIESEVGLSERGILSLILKKVPTIYKELPFHNIPYKRDRITAQILLSRLSRCASDYLLKEHYLQIEPMYLSARWIESGIEPLKVFWPGYGGPGYLVPSSQPQLLNAIIVSGWNKVFCVTRCFTLTYRDAITGSESLIISAKALSNDLNETISSVVNTLSELFNKSTIVSDSCALFRNIEWNRIEFEIPCDPAKLAVQQPEVQIFTKCIDDIKKNIVLFRICMPPNVIIAEGYVEEFGGEALGSFTIHLERVAQLIGPIELRRLLILCNTIQ